MRYQPIDPQLFITNRRRLQERLEPGQHVVLRAAKDRGAIDESFPYRQDSNFFWATGISQPDCVLAMSAAEEVLYARQANEFEQIWLNPRLTLKQAAEVSGIADVRPLSRYRRPDSQIDATSTLAELRMVKQPMEVELIKRSIAITADGLRDLAAAIRPGAVEYELEAEFTRQVIHQGATNAWPPVVASGPNTCVIHYGNNNRILTDGDLLLVDVGAEYAHYDADVSRTYAVSGKLSGRQQEVYEAVTAVQRFAIGLLKPGVVLIDYERQVAEHMFETLKNLGAASQSDQQLDARGWPKWRYLFPHRTSHYLGLDAHDLGNYEKPLEPGVVLTVEPGIYIPNEGIGVRLEDDILITENGAINLSVDVPRA